MCQQDGELEAALGALFEAEVRTVGLEERELAFRVNANNSIWSYELEPTANGTRLVESRHAENGTKATSTFTINALFGGVPSFERELIDGMNTSLARIKAAAES